MNNELINKNIQNPDENTGISIKEKFNLTPSQAYGLDMRVVKHGRIYKPYRAIENKESELPKEVYNDNSSPKIVKQTRPLKKITNKSRKNINKDVIIAT